MNIPLELIVISNSQIPFPNFQTFRGLLQQQFPGIVIHEISYANTYGTIRNFSPKTNRIFLICTQNITPNQQILQIITTIDSIGGEIIMFPTPISNNSNHALARSPEQIIMKLNQLTRQNPRGLQPGMTSNIQMIPSSNIPAVMSSRAVSPMSNIGAPKLGVNYFKSNNQIFKRDMNRLLLNYQSDRRVKFNEISNLNQIPVMPGGQHIIFVNDQDANIFISQLNIMGGRADKFFPILYNTSSRSIPTGNYFVLAVNSFPRAITEINSYLNGINSFGSQNSISEQIAMSASTIPVNPSTIPGNHGNFQSTTSHTLIQNPYSSTNIPYSSTNIPSFGYTRLMVLDPGSMYFSQFYRSLPVEYKLIHHLQQNAVFKEPTILLAPFSAYEHVMNRIYPQATNIECVFYAQQASNRAYGNSRLTKLVSSNTRQIQAYLRSRNVNFMSNNVTTIRNHTTIEQDQQVSAFLGMNGGNNMVSAIGAGGLNMLSGIGGNRAKHYSYEWTTKRKPGGQRHLTFLSEQQQIHMARGMNTHIQSNIHMNTNTQKQLVGSMQNNFQINSIPNQSQMIIGNKSFGSPKNNVNNSQIKQVTTTTTIKQVPVPLTQTSKVIEEVYEQTVIEARNKQPSHFEHQQSHHTFTIDQIPIIPTIEITPPPVSTSRIETSYTQQINNQPIIIPPQTYHLPPPIITTQVNQVIAPVIKQVITQHVKVAPVVPISSASRTIVQVPPITNGYYSNVTSTTIPITNPIRDHYTANYRESYTTHSPVRSPSPITNISRRVESQWMDPIKYQKTFQNGKVTYVMKQQYKNRLIDEAVNRNGVTTYRDDHYINHSPRGLRKSKVIQTTYVSPSYNQVQYIVDNPKIRRSRVVYQDMPATSYTVGGTHLLETQLGHTGFDPLKYQGRIQNGVQVYYKRSSVSPLRKSNNFVVEHVGSPIQYVSSTPIYSHQPLRRSYVIQERVPTSSSRVLIQNPSREIIELRKSGAGLRGSRVIRMSRGDQIFMGRHQPVHLIFKKLNSMLVSTSQLFKDPNYHIHKYYTTNQLAALAHSIPKHQPILLIVDDVPDSNDHFCHHSNFNTIIIPKSNQYSRANQIKYPKYKWISQSDPQRAYGDIITYIDQYVYNTTPNRYVNRVSNDLNHFVSPSHYSNNTHRVSTNQAMTRPSPINSSKKVLLFPITRTQVRDVVDSRLPNYFQFIPYSDMNSLTKQLDYWPGSNLIAILSQPLAQQIGTIMRISRNADYIVYDPDNRYGYQKQDYNSIKRVRDVNDLVVELQYLTGGIRGRSYR